MMQGDQEVYIASLDIGTTTIRCYVFDSHCNVKGKSYEMVQLINNQPGYFEIEPNNLWRSIKKVIYGAINSANLSPENIACLGVSTQRCTFITWDRETEEYFHNFITWKDLRADQLVKEWNSSLLLKTIKSISYMLYLITRSNRFLAGSVIKMMNNQVTMRLLWQMKNNERLKKAIEKKTALFGTLDSWVLYKLRKGNQKDLNIKNISDVTSCSATGLFDPFTLSWATWAFSLFSIKEEMLPEVVDNSYDFGYVHESIFGAPIKISCSISDQSAAMWGSSCFKENDMKITLGTGSFLNLNTSSTCHASVHGLYPLVAWKFSSKKCNLNDLVYCVEGAVNDIGTVINWAQSIDLFGDPSTSSEIAECSQDSAGLYFIPAFSGLGPPINNHQAASGFLGIQPTTTKPQLVRALLESIVFRVTLIYKCTMLETNYKLKRITVDGGVSKNNFICQMLADVTGLIVERPENTESSTLGAAFVAAINQGIWEMDNIKKFHKIEHTFTPRPELQEKLKLKMKTWEQAMERFKDWYVS